MTKQHAWACISHNFFGFCPLRGFVAMHRAVRARRFVLSVGTFQQTPLRVIQKRLALSTQGVPGIVVVSRAVDANHLGHGQVFTGNAFL